MNTNGCSKKLCPMQVGAVDNCTLTKEQCPYFTQDIDYQKALRTIKAMVAMEILNEIEFDINNLDFDREETRAIAIEGVIAKLKKKYTEDRT